MGWTFLWAFLDKTFALGFATGRDPESGVIAFFGKDQAWLNGGSPTEGVLVFATKGPLKGLFQGLGGCNAETMSCASNGWLDIVFMASMLLIGLGLLTGVMTRLAAIGGALWMVIFYLAIAIWPDNNPFVDNHVIEFVVLLGLIWANAGRSLGFGKWWQAKEVVQKHPILS